MKKYKHQHLHLDQNPLIYNKRGALLRFRGVDVFH